MDFHSKSNRKGSKPNKKGNTIIPNPIKIRYDSVAEFITPLNLIATGGSCKVYRAIIDERDVAIKVLDDNNYKFRKYWE
ncbi:putative receptor-like protein kinase, partial [Corchorus capsularis]